MTDKTQAQLYTATNGKQGMSRDEVAMKIAELLGEFVTEDINEKLERMEQPSV